MHLNAPSQRTSIVLTSPSWYAQPIQQTARITRIPVPATQYGFFITSCGWDGGVTTLWTDWTGFKVGLSRDINISHPRVARIPSVIPLENAHVIRNVTLDACSDDAWEFCLTGSTLTVMRHRRRIYTSDKHHRPEHERVLGRIPTEETLDFWIPQSGECAVCGCIIHSLG